MALSPVIFSLNLPFVNSFMSGGGAVEVLEPGECSSQRVPAARRRPSLAAAAADPVRLRRRRSSTEARAVQTSQPPAAQQDPRTPTVDARARRHIGE